MYKVSAIWSRQFQKQYLYSSPFECCLVELIASEASKHQQLHSHPQAIGHLNQQQQQQFQTGADQSSAIYHAYKQMNVLFFGLQMLGFDLAANEKKYNIKLNAQMSPNPIRKRSTFSCTFYSASWTPNEASGHFNIADRACCATSNATSKRPF